MSGEFPFSFKFASPVKCNEKPWDLWVSEIGHSSPMRGDDVVDSFPSPAERETKSISSRRFSDLHPYKATSGSRLARHRRSGVNRLRFDTMSLHGLFPQMDNLNAAVCHMCGVSVKCSAAYRHLLETHSTSVEPILPPPPPAPTVKLKLHNRSRHKKDLLPPPTVDMIPVSIENTPVHTNITPLSRLVLPQPELQYLDEASTSSAVSGEVQVCVESGELPVVSIQDTEDLPLGENITDDIFAIMNSEGIQSADDITNVADWKNIIRDIGNMQDINFTNETSQDSYPSVDAGTLPQYAISESELSSLQFPPNTSPMLSNVIDNTMLNAQITKPVAPSVTTPSSKTHSRSKTSKTKYNMREYDPNKHCGVVTSDNPKPCTRSLTCKAHALSLRRIVEGRSKPFDTLLAEHRAARDPTTASNTTVSATAPIPPPVSLPIPPSLLVNTNIDLSSFNGLTAEQQVNDIYASLLAVEDPSTVLPDTSAITSLFSQSLPADHLFLTEEPELSEVPILSIASPTRSSAVTTSISSTPPAVVPEEHTPTLVPSDVCWYTTCPRPLALCTFNTSHAGGAVTLGKKFATVRSNIKDALSRSQCKAGGPFYSFNPAAKSLSKTVHMNSVSKCAKPEIRKLVVTPARGGVNELGLAVNGHVCSREEEARRRVRLRPGKRPTLELGFSLDPLLADEKC